MKFDLEFYRGRRVLITGHTGFKGSWMCAVLAEAGAEVTGYALKPPTEPSLFSLLGLADRIRSVEGDVRNLEHLQQVFQETRPEIVIHMAAQPLVRESYQNPVYTYDTNVMGTVHVMECVRHSDSVRSFVNVTTDKVYRNREWEWGYRENEELDGYDPYSNSKSCSELVTETYRRSFFQDRDTAVTTMRAGNVVGGGDFAEDRIIPDCVRAAQAGKEIVLRNPDSVRPYQHVLEPVMAYLMVAQRQYLEKEFAGAYNVGPQEDNCVTTAEMASCFCRVWNRLSGEKLSWRAQPDGGPHEARLLKLDCTRLKETFGWRPVWNVDSTIEKVAEWYYRYHTDTADALWECTRSQIAEYIRDAEKNI